MWKKKVLSGFAASFLSEAFRQRRATRSALNKNPAFSGRVHVPCQTRAQYHASRRRKKQKAKAKN
jgi:hypothetical protein